MSCRVEVVVVVVVGSEKQTVELSVSVIFTPEAGFICILCLQPIMSLTCTDKYIERVSDTLLRTFGRFPF